MTEPTARDREVAYHIFGDESDAPDVAAIREAMARAIAEDDNSTISWSSMNSLQRAPYYSAAAAALSCLATPEVVERVKVQFGEQMEDQQGDTTPSSIQRDKGMVWIEGWFDLRAVIAAITEQKP